MNSIKISSISAVLALVVMFSAATTVSADTGFFDGGYEGGFFDGGFDSGFSDGGWDSGFYDGGWDSGFYDGGWDSGLYDGGWDSGFYDGGWDSGLYDGGWDSGLYDGGWDTGFYGDSYNPGYFETDSYHPGYIETDSYHPGYIETDSYHPGYIETDSYHPGYVETDSYFPGYTDTTYEVVDSYGQSYSIPSFGGSGFTLVPPTYSMPRPTPTYPTPTYPTPRPTPPAPQPPVTNNNCVNNSCNNTNTNINNINTNTNTNVTTVSQATPGPIVQYVAPQYPVYPQYYNQAPYCYITIGQSYYSSGMITLTWSSQGATSAYITPQVGQVAPNGSTSLYAYGNTVYSLTVTGPGGTYTCRTQSYAAPYAPVSPYVSLSQIPYTGITMGPVASAMYWTGMIALAIAGAYLLVYYRGGALALATSMVSTGKRDAHEEATVLHEEVTYAAPVLPTTQGSAMTRDAMKIVRSEDGTPRLVISRS